MDEQLINIIRNLRDEAAFVQSEKKHLIELYKQLLKRSEQLFNKQWVIARQHLLLDDLIFGRNKLTTAQSCTKFSFLANNTQFIESYKVFGPNDYYVCEFLKSLREKPAHLARLIIKSEKYTQSSTQLINGVDNQYFTSQQLIPIYFQSLYGNCVLKQDEVICLQLLNNLMKLQFGAGTSDLNQQQVVDGIHFRRLIRKQSCSFNILFKLYTSFAYSAQLFLTAALYEPITQILTDEWFLDIDYDKTFARFSSEELTNRFGQPNTKEYKLKTQKYREKIVNQLYTITMSFIDNINANLFCFPSSLSWLVSQLYQIINKNSSKSSTQHETARKLCCDLIMALYICPAICDPEPYGVISDIQLSTVSRHNLMQIANILQTLAMSDDDKDLKAQDLYSKFRNSEETSNCVSDILNNIISTHKLRNNGVISGLNDSLSIPQFDQPNTNVLSNSNQSNNNNNSNIETASIQSSSLTSTNNNNLLSRTSILISLQDLHKILIYMREMSKDKNELIIESEETKWLKSILPLDYINQTLDTAAINLTKSSNLTSFNNINLSSSSNVPRNKSTSTLNQLNYSCESSEVITSLLKEINMDQLEGFQVVVATLNDKDSNCPGMLSEEKILIEQENSASKGALLLNVQDKLSNNRKNRDQRHTNKLKKNDVKLEKVNSNISNSDVLETSLEPGNIGTAESIISSSKPMSDLGIDRDETRSRHEGSVEGISEACEPNDCRSISSNDEDDVDNQNDDDEDAINNENQLGDDDDLSDFDNFSGRDTPIISGRDTPSSHSHEDLHNMSSSNRSNINNANSINHNNAGGGVNNNGNINNANVNNSNTIISNNSNSNANLNPSRGPQLPITVQKANGEDINDKFCKFEINKINAPREEQLSETGWSLDADPPESVNNEPINDRLGLDENSTSSNANTMQNNSSYNRLNSFTSINRQPSANLLANNNSIINSSSSNNVINSSGSTNNNNNNNNNNNSSNSVNLINFNTDQDSLIPNSNILQPINSSSIAQIANDSVDQNLDDRYSVVSDNAAWSTDMINNSDSDLESNSPSKYTPYSTYSSCSGTNHLPLSGNLISDLTSNNVTNSNNLASQPLQTSTIQPSSSSSQISMSTKNNSYSVSYFASAANNDLNKSNTDSGLISWNYSNNSNNQQTSNSSSQTNVLIPNSNYSVQQLEQSLSTNPSHVPPASSNHKHKLSSIFSSSNSSNVKFSLNNSVSGSSGSKRSSIQKFFAFHKQSSKNSNQNDPFASLNPFATQSLNANTNASSTNNSNQENQTDNIENILKKYSSKNTSTISTQQSLVSNNDTEMNDSSSLLIQLKADNQDAGSALKPINVPNNIQQINDRANLIYDPKNLEQSKVFLDAKKKLRIVLSLSDCCTYNFMPLSHYKNEKDNYLTMYLKAQLYDAISLQDKEKEAQLYETMRIVSIFSEQECNKLLRSLKKDYIKRIYYVTYLTKSKQSVLYSINLIEKLLQRAEWNQRLCTHHLASVISRSFLETKENENQMYKFIVDFRKLVAVDEKFDLFKKYIVLLKKDYDPIWSRCHEDIVQLGHLSLERLILSKVYRFVMFPNGEIDHYRDTKVSECFNELANVITPSHPLIGIPPIYQNECPWTAAQMELRRLNIYKTPKDKLDCIHKCMLIIQNLLAIAKSPVCADDLHPVLIYVIIKANPPTFLSNVQYIEGYYGNQLEFEDYYWAQFIFAFSYIKANMLGTKVTSNTSTLSNNTEVL